MPCPVSGQHAPPRSSRIALVNVNTASAADMAKILPNIGPVRAAAIVKARPYATPQDLVTKGALTPGVFNGIRGLVTAG
jgi:DNA uptake protein ComE-like DNA-binding protein